MNNEEFLKVLEESFLTYLKTSARSNQKLIVLHSAIARDLITKLNDDIYSISSLGYGEGKESKIEGRYFDKLVDITIFENNKPIAGISVKFIMSNYLQNSNNYFETMMGETANIRSAEIAYFQVFIIPRSLPYFDKTNNIQKWEEVTAERLKKYIKLSEDNKNIWMHIPNKTLVFIVDIENNFMSIPKNKEEYQSMYTTNKFKFTISNLNLNFEKNIIYNDYDKFIAKVVNIIKGW
ncbi:hypothetical protein [Mycoplasmopsis gallopavonis]|uniref:Uncharacterized protein n=1 Tax=Mycoplasmopsis gallopavonis TaxID=76629 RepID=A0A449AYH7_9BACT|nr:hypothetical protein [Mycoplasmopsis gallopavonis]RIV16502.1 hypothetical protein D1113_02110 [Mycoplasmopsis gallopavonis]VEU72599.1 Uncharacterised protein [Mycoplasmopsis gallopavonis]